MTKDIAPALKKAVLDDYDEAKHESVDLEQLLKKLESKKGSWVDGQDLAGAAAKCLQDSFKANITEEVLPNGQMYFNIADRVIPPALKQLWTDVSDACCQIQEGLTKKARIGIKPIQADLNEDRIKGIVDRISSEPFDDVKWLLGAPVDNFARSVVDDHVKANADFHFRSGLKPKIVRKTDGKCCKWCTSHAGSYDYSPDMDREVFRRHENCGCTVEYDPADGSRRRQHIHDKTWRETGEMPEDSKEKIQKSVRTKLYNKFIDSLSAENSFGELDDFDQERIKQQHYIEEAKITRYLLLPNGKHAGEFFDVGYTENDKEKLERDILEQISRPSTDRRPSRYGARISIVMELGITKRKLFLVTFQCEENGYRLITAHRIS